jgi:hypothetical protein
MNETTFICNCLADLVDGLRDGLTHFSGPSRAAVIYALAPDQPVYIYDPQNLLRGHEPRFRELYLDNRDWQKIGSHQFLQNGSFHIVP